MLHGKVVDTELADAVRNVVLLHLPHSSHRACNPQGSWCTSVPGTGQSPAGAEYLHQGPLAGAVRGADAGALAHLGAPPATVKHNAVLCRGCSLEVSLLILLSFKLFSDNLFSIFKLRVLG